MGDAKALDAMVHDGLTNPFSGRQMFDEATEIGDELEITRPDLDRWALRTTSSRSRRPTRAACPRRRPVTVKGRKGDTVVEVDEAPRRGSTLEALAKLPGLVGKEGSQTAGNSPGVNDGAGAIVLASDEWAAANGKEVLAEIVAHAQPPTTSPTSPRRRERGEERAREGRPQRRGHRPLGDQRGLLVGRAELDPDARHRRGAGQRNGGAVALGHPIGASGARIIGTLVHELRRRGGGLGCAAICSGGGQGDAIIVKVEV